MVDPFLAKVVADNNDGTFTVTPQIIEHDGTMHPDVLVSSIGGITPEAGDTVLIVATRNTLDDTPIQRYFEASEACGRIIDIVKKSAGPYLLTGDYKFDGDFSCTGDVQIDGKCTIDKDVKVKGNMDIDGTLTIAGKPYTGHTHNGVTPGSGSSGTVNP